MRIADDRHGAHFAPNLVRWGAVFSGAVIALAVYALGSSLWLALAYNDNDSSGWITGNLAWFLGGTAVFSLFLAGLLAGFLSGVRGVLSGALNGVTAWGLLVLGSLLTVLPVLTSATASLGQGVGSGTGQVAGGLGASSGGITAETAVWTTFWSLLIGITLATAGGIIGGLIKRDAPVADVDTRGTHDHGDPYPVTETSSVEVGRTRPVATAEPVRRDPGLRH